MGISGATLLSSSSSSREYLAAVGSVGRATVGSGVEPARELSNADATLLEVVWLWKGVVEERRKIAVPFARPSRRSLDNEDRACQKGGDGGRG